MYRPAMLAMLTVVGAISVLAAGRPLGPPPQVVTVTFDRFTLRASLPAGWLVEDGQVLPPLALRPSCHVRGEFYQGRDWNRSLAAALDLGNVELSSKERRSLFRVGGHTAVKSEYTDGSQKLVENVYIDLSDLEARNDAVWSFEGDNSAEGRQCEMEFGQFIGSAAIELRSGAASADVHPGGE